MSRHLFHRRKEEKKEKKKPSLLLFRGFYETYGTTGQPKPT
jgi:hypothetical protein